MDIVFINLGTTEIIVFCTLFLSVLFFVVLKLLRYLRGNSSRGDEKMHDK